MNKNCARCNKVAYPMETLSLLDKTWHKTCFKCTECNMALNMKTYKGYNKNPYCEAHIPKAKATTIADTPELKRIAENTKIQSNVKYHADFEMAKGKLTQVADDPETLRIRQNSKNISNAAYHGDSQKKAAMERQRELTEIVDSKDNNESEYFSEQLAAESLPHYQPPPPVAQPAPKISPPSSQYSSMDSNHANNNNHHREPQYQPAQAPVVPQQMHKSAQMQYNNNNHMQPPQQPTNGAQSAQNGQITHLIRNSASNPSGGGSGGALTQQQMQQQIQQKYYDQYENYARPNPSGTAAPPAQVQAPQNGHGHNNNHMSAVQQLNGSQNNQNGYTKQYATGPPTQQPAPGYQQQQMAYNNHYNQQNGGKIAAPASNGSVGKIADYDPLTDGPRNAPYNARQSSTLIYSSDRATLNASQEQQQRRIGSVNDLDPVNGYYGPSRGTAEQQQKQLYHQQQLQMQQQQQIKMREAMQQQQYIQQTQQREQRESREQREAQTMSKARIYRALYDYEAQDTDEVSFSEGDLIFEVNSIDAGWMTGRVERSGATGMLPANYVELAMI